MDHAQRLLELSLYNQSLGKAALAKKYQIESSRLLNEQLDKSSTKDSDLIGLCRIALDNKLTISDKIIWMSSQIGDNFFPPVFEGLKTYIDCNEVYQEKLFSVPECFESVLEWTSCTDLPSEWTNNGVDSLFQDSLDDCSFVASFLSCAGVGLSLMNNVTPHTDSFKYAVKLTFNGYERSVFVDSRLPLLKNTSKSLRVTSSSNKALLWPSIVEKAFLKVFDDDGYKFSGSNSAIASYALTGWIPEVIETSSCTVSDIRCLYEDFRNGNIVLCLGTGNLTEQECTQYGLIPSHDYAVTRLSFTDDLKYQFEIRNPWNEGRRTVNITDVSIFEVIYANRNPKMYSYEHQLSGICQTKNNDEFKDLIFDLPQYSLCNNATSTVEVVLFIERHVLRKDVQAESHIEVFQSNGKRLVSRRNKASKGSLFNNTNFNFMTIELEASEKVTVVIDFGNSSVRSQPFTLKAFTNDSNISLKKALTTPNYLKQIDLELTPLNSGGNWDNYGYYKNPQVILNFKGASAEEAVLECDVLSKSDKTLFTYTVFWKSEDPDFPFVTRAKNKLVSTDNEYKCRSCSLSKLTSCDKSYLFVLSSYEPDTIDSFKVFFQCTHDFSVERVETSLGLFSKEFTFSWGDQLVKEFTIHISNPSRLKVHAVNTDNKRRSKLNCSLAFQKTVISCLDDYTDNLYGCFISGNCEVPGKYLLQVHKNVLSIEECLVEIGSSSSFEFWKNH